MRSGALVLAALLLTIGPSEAAPAPAPLAVGQVSITGDSFVVEDSKHQATFTGNVVVTQTQVKLTADKVVAFYGDAGPSSITSFVATGNVRIATKDQTGTGERAEFSPKTRILKLTGNVIVENAGGRVQGAEMDVDLNRNALVFSGGKSGRVTGVFNPQ